MKKLISFILSLALLSTNMLLYAQTAKKPQLLLEGNIEFYQKFPEYLVREIEDHIALSQKYIISLPTATESNIKATQKILSEKELHFAKVFKRTIKDDAFLYDVFESLTKNSTSMNKKLSLEYLQQLVGSLEAGQTPRSAVNVLKSIPSFYNRTALVMLEKSSDDFAKIVAQLEKTFNLPRAKAVSLALSIEIELAQKKLDGEIASLRDKIAWKKHSIRKAGARADRQIAQMRSELAAAQKELLELKKVYSNPESILSYSLGKEETENIVKFLSHSNLDNVTIVRAFSSANIADKFLAKMRALSKSMKSFLPAAIGTGLFLTVFSAQASAATSDKAENEVMMAVSNRTQLKREVFTAINQNPDNIGIIYTGGPQVKNMVAELLENEGDNSLSSEYLISYIEDWSNRLNTLLNNPEAMQAYLSSIKEINTSLKTLDEDNFNKRIHKDLTMPKDNTAVYKNIPMELF